MKKLLILVLVLTMATLANAALSWAVKDSTGAAADMDKLDLGETYTLIVSGTAAMKPFFGGLYPVDPFTSASTEWDNITMSNPQILGKAGDLSYNNPNPYYLGYEIGTDESGKGANVQDGEWFSWDFSADSEGSVSWNFFDYATSYYTAVGTLTGTIIPEPITIALLGLGGLFLRRK